jgi:predicted PurR-regulated permease PerM/ubiquinone/menaquinone biosynthesis C-methylase UbiE
MRAAMSVTRARVPHDIPTPRAVLRVVAVVVLSGLALYLLYRVRFQLGMLALALFLAVCASGPVNALSRHMKRGFAILIVYLGIILIPCAIIAILVPPVVRQAVELAGNLPSYVQEIDQAFDENEQLRELNENYDITGKLTEYADDAIAAIGQTASALLGVGAGLIGSIFTLVTILVLSIFMVARGNVWVEAALATRPPQEARAARRAINRMAGAVAGYVGGALAQASVAGVTSFVMLTILGVPGALPLAVIMALLDLVPLVGATIGAVIVGVVTVFADFPSDTIIWTVFAIAYQQFENYVVQPRIQSRAVELDPFIVVVAAIFGGALLGIIGALLAIPTAAVIQVAVREYLAFRREPALRAMWAAGDYPRYARELMPGMGPALVEAAGIGPDDRVLDVAAGPGTVALPAARTGARVVASDLTPELLTVGRRQADDEGLVLDWIEADAAMLPFADGEFDVVCSAIGAIYSPDQEATAAELVRVCRPGGTIGMANWAPGSWTAEFWETLVPFMTARQAKLPSPLHWGDEAKLRKLLGDKIASLALHERTEVVTHFATPIELREYHKAYFGPVIALYERFAGDPNRTADLDRALLAFAERTNRAAPGEPARYDIDYLLVVAQRAAK